MDKKKNERDQAPPQAVNGQALPAAFIVPAQVMQATLNYITNSSPPGSAGPAIEVFLALSQCRPAPADSE